jgi:uncharacterized protein (TIGR02996 family)
MPDEQTFLDEITASPDDDIPRLIYADWLEENGDPRGEFIRVQCELATLRKTQKRYADLSIREAELLLQYQRQWTEGFPYSLRKCVFRRGFIEACSVALSYFLRNSDKILRLSPLRDVVFTQTKDKLPALARCPGLSRLRSVQLKQLNWPVDVQDFASSPYLNGVEAIRGRWTTKGLIALARSPHTGTLRELEFEGDFWDEGIEAIADADHLRLRKLNLSYGVANTSIQYLSRAKFGPTLEDLNLNGTDIQDRELMQLVESPSLTALTVLRASKAYGRSGVRGEALMALAASPRLAKLRTLVLTNHPLSYESIVAIGESPYRAKGAKYYFGSIAAGLNNTLTPQQLTEIKSRFGRTFGHL